MISTGYLWGRGHVSVISASWAIGKAPAVTQQVFVAFLLCVPGAVWHCACSQGAHSPLQGTQPGEGARHSLLLWKVCVHVHACVRVCVCYDCIILHTSLMRRGSFPHLTGKITNISKGVNNVGQVDCNPGRSPGKTTPEVRLLGTSPSWPSLGQPPTDLCSKIRPQAAVWT